MPVDRDEFDWLLACFAWLTREFGAIAAGGVVVPDEAAYPRSRLTGHARASELFEQTRGHARMPADAWPCALREGAADRERSIALGHALRHHDSKPLGTFGYDDGYFITYNPKSLARPQALVATFAHELAHYLLHTAKTPAPGGAALEEHATDVGAVFLGFGVFMSNSAQNFGQFEGGGEIGWEMQSAGYLSENALVTATAISVRLSGAEAKPVEQELKDYLRPVFRRTVAAIDRGWPDLAASVAAVDLAEWA